jgi:ribosome biogenesis GTPase A
LTQIQWFPGHMAKARREMSEALKKVDAVLELVDARLPIASGNPMLRELIQNKPRVIVMTRMDLADPQKTDEWTNFLRKQGAVVVSADTRTGGGVNHVLPALEQVAAGKRERDARKGIRPRPLRTMVVGIPNVGKSSLINRLAKRSATKTGDRPGITKTQQWIRLGSVELLDTPGVLWPKFESEKSAYALAMSGAIKSDVIDMLEVCTYFVAWVSSHYPNALSSRYEIDDLPVTPWLGVSDTYTVVEPVLSAISKRRGLIRSGGVPDIERTADLIMRETQTGQLGRMSFEWPEESD